MEIPVLITAIFMGVVFVGGIISAIVTSRRQNARKESAPSKHRGKFQSQKGRVYKKGSTNHSSSPWSPG